MIISRRNLVFGTITAGASGLLVTAYQQLTMSLRVRDVEVPTVDSAGNIIARHSASALYFSETLGDSVTLDVALIPGGDALLGSALTPAQGISEQPIRSVQIASFGLGTFPVTRLQWHQVSKLPMVATTLSGFPPTLLDGEQGDLPVDSVRWVDTEEFCQRLSRATGRNYRIPSEAEWEYACRAATDTLYHFGNNISQSVANFNDGITRPVQASVVGSRNTPNRYGLHDMHGNVFEWCADWVHEGYDGAPNNGSAWNFGGDSNTRVIRGGSFAMNADRARSAARTRGDVRGTSSVQGLRVAVDLAVDILDPRFSRQGLVEAAQLSAGIAAGSIVSLFGANIGPTTPAEMTPNEAGLLRTDLAGVQVLFNRKPAPLLFVSRNQINAIVPLGLSDPAIEVLVKNQGQTSMPVSAAWSEAAPALFTINGSGTGQGAILNQDYSVNTTAKPATPGSIVSLYATGTGPTNPAGGDGEIVQAPLPRCVLPVQVKIAGIDAPVEYAGGALGLVFGVTQVNVRIPQNVPRGQVSVALIVGTAESPPGVTIAVA